MRGLEVWSRGIEWLLAGWLAAAGGVWAVPPPGYELADEGHLDFVFCYVGGVWSSGLIWDRTGNPVHGGAAEGVLRPAAMVPVVARDEAYATGSRSRRPAGEEWDFLGVREGEPFWWFPQIRTGTAWPGFAVCGDCDPYFEDDPRVAAASSWKTLDLKRVRYRGRGKGDYSMWSTGTFGDVTVWMSTADGGITGKDRFFVSASGHAHAAMGFSDLGLYEVTYTATCYAGPNKTFPVTSPEVSFYFAVGTYWEWSTEDSSGGGWAAMAHSFDLPPWGPADRGFRLVVTLQDAIDYGPF